MTSWFKKRLSGSDSKKKSLESALEGTRRRLKQLQDQNRSPESCRRSLDSSSDSGSGSKRVLRSPPALDFSDGYLLQQPHPLPCVPPQVSSGRTDSNCSHVSLSPLPSLESAFSSHVNCRENPYTDVVDYDSDSASNVLSSQDSPANRDVLSFHMPPRQTRRSYDDLSERFRQQRLRNISSGPIPRPRSSTFVRKSFLPSSPLQNQSTSNSPKTEVHGAIAEEIAAYKVSHGPMPTNLQKLMNPDQPLGSGHRSPRRGGFEGSAFGRHGISISTDVGPCSRIQSTPTSPLHPSINFSENGLVVAHPLPLPPSPPPQVPMQMIGSSQGTYPGRPNKTVNFATGWQKGVLIGSGTFGQVYAGFHSETGEMCAIKEVHLIPDDERSMESARQLTQEISLLSQMKHPNIVQYYGSETIEDRLYIYLEYMSGGSIHKLLQQYGPISESCIRGYTRQILSGLAYLHSNKTVHRDIKGANILVDKGGIVKLADFGMAKHISTQACPLSFKGSPYWMAPEVIQNKKSYDFAVDIWSLGCTILEMATGKPPWSQFEGIAAMFKIGNTKEIPEIPKFFSDDAKNFSRSCLQRDPNDRPTAAQLLEHPFVRSEAMEKNVSAERFTTRSVIMASSSNVSTMNSGCSTPTRGVGGGAHSLHHPDAMQKSSLVSEVSTKLFKSSRPQGEAGGRLSRGISELRNDTQWTQLGCQTVDCYNTTTTGQEAGVFDDSNKLVKAEGTTMGEFSSSREDSERLLTRNTLNAEYGSYHQMSQPFLTMPFRQQSYPFVPGQCEISYAS